MPGLLAAPFAAACVLLVGAGLPKLRDPMPLVRALRSVGLPASRWTGRLLAAAEVAVGGWALAAPGRLTAALVSAAYLLFTGFVALALARGGVLGSCGCFGKADTPPTRTHLGLTALVVVLAAAVAVRPASGGWGPGLTAEAATTAGYAALLAFLAWQVLAVLPALTPAAVRSTTKG